jgi:membrane associated rhomboid family serine protease
MKISAVKGLMVANVLFFALQLMSVGGSRDFLLEDLFALWPLQPIEGHTLFRPWQIVTYAFLHSTENYAHLLFNMFGLWMFGTEIERYVGPRRLLTCYFASVVSAALAQLFVPMLFGSEPSPTIGASGGVFGLILAYAVMFPRRKVAVYFLIPMPTWLFATLYAALELFQGVTGNQTGVAHFAHLGGMVGSALVIMQWRRSIARR